MLGMVAAPADQAATLLGTASLVDLLLLGASLNWRSFPLTPGGRIAAPPGQVAALRDSVNWLKPLSSPPR